MVVDGESIGRIQIRPSSNGRIALAFRPENGELAQTRRNVLPANPAFNRWQRSSLFTFATPIPYAQAAAIARAYAPVLLYDDDEDFHAVGINAMLENSRLLGTGKLRAVIKAPQAADLARENHDDAYLDLFNVKEGSTNEKFWADVAGDYEPTYYARIFKWGEHLVAQYWFFYVYNNGPGGGIFDEDHEGDWEIIQLVWDNVGASLILDHGGRPLPSWLGYAAHEWGNVHAFPTVKWYQNGRYVNTAPNPQCFSACSQQERLQPIVYVAEGSHASYAAPKASREIDRCGIDFLASGSTERCDRADGARDLGSHNIIVIRGDEQWLDWQGSWGRPDGENKIRGPRQQGIRDNKPWTNPLCWSEWRASGDSVFLDEERRGCQ